MSALDVTVRPMRPRLDVEVQPTPAPPTEGVQINDAAPSTQQVYSSQRTEDVAEEARDELVYNYDGLVAAVLTI